MLTASEIAERLARCARESPTLRGERSRPDEVALVLASKTQPAEAVRAAYDAGARDFGENYMQEAALKLAAVAEAGRRAMASHRASADQQDEARGVELRSDSERRFRAAGLRDRAERSRAPPVRALIEVNLAARRPRPAWRRTTSKRLIEAARDRVEIIGLMTIPPPGATPPPRAGISRSCAGCATGLRRKWPCAKRAFDGNDGGLRNGD